jgi:hypothetical protein
VEQANVPIVARTQNVGGVLQVPSLAPSRSSASRQPRLFAFRLNTWADAAGQLVVSSRNGVAAERRVPDRIVASWREFGNVVLHLMPPAWPGGRICDELGWQGRMKPIGGCAETHRTVRHKPTCPPRVVLTHSHAIRKRLLFGHRDRLNRRKAAIP